MATMTWTKIGYELWTSPEFGSANRDAQLLHIEAMSWCNAHGTDGHLPRAMLRRVTTSDDPDGAAAECVRAGLWENEAPGWYLVHFLDDQPSSEKVRRDQAANAVRVRRARLHGAGDHSECLPGRKECHAMSNAITSAASDTLSAAVRPSVRPTVREEGRKGGRFAPAAAGALAGSTRPVDVQYPKLPENARNHYPITPYLEMMAEPDDDGPDRWWIMVGYRHEPLTAVAPTGDEPIWAQLSELGNDLRDSFAPRANKAVADDLDCLDGRINFLLPKAGALALWVDIQRWLIERDGE